MANKVTATFFIIAFLFISFTLTKAVRPEPFAKYPNAVAEIRDEDDGQAETCEGEGKEDCLMRRTLAAHIDYIYTQKTNP
ncbi:phytosulfokines precursor, putative [Ricinus communis]|uniref:Phytosulfokine n=2 Tax=Ricinus communis TaxID=3988 RepID=B9S801_RICCO|nr:phytosulfokines precursor, putative [Ricinus communis]|eukprot:XP_002522117.1 phytosulfokines [Ricinus communis]